MKKIFFCTFICILSTTVFVGNIKAKSNPKNGKKSVVEIVSKMDSELQLSTDQKDALNDNL